MEILYALIKSDDIPGNDMKLFEHSLSNILISISEKNKNITYKKGCKSCAHIHIVLAKQRTLDHIFPHTDLNFSWTDQKSNFIMFSYENWKNMYLHEDNTFYQKYVIIHEFLHAFPFYQNHNKNTCNENSEYNVMYQQTRNSYPKNKIKPNHCNNKRLVIPDNMKLHDFDYENNRKHKKDMYQKYITAMKK